MKSIIILPTIKEDMIRMKKVLEGVSLIFTWICIASKDRITMDLIKKTGKLHINKVRMMVTMIIMIKVSEF